MRKMIFIGFLVMLSVSIFFSNGFSQSNEEIKEMEELAKEPVSKEALRAIDDILSRRISKIMQKNKEDEAFRSKFNKQYEDELTYSNALLEYFQGRKQIMKVITREIQESHKEINDLATKFYKRKPGYNLVTVFKDYFIAYQNFMNAALSDIEDKFRAAKMYQAIVLIETNQNYFYNTLERNNLQKAKECLSKEAELIGNYSKELGSFSSKKIIPDKWKKNFVEAYTRIHEHNKRLLEAKTNRDDNAYEKTIVEGGTKIMLELPWIKSAIFSKEVLENLEDIPKEIIKLEEYSRKMGIKAYSVYFIQKEKVGEKPIKF